MSLYLLVRNDQIQYENHVLLKKILNIDLQATQLHPKSIARKIFRFGPVKSARNFKFIPRAASREVIKSNQVYLIIINKIK